MLLILGIYSSYPHETTYPIASTCWLKIDGVLLGCVLRDLSPKQGALRVNEEKEIIWEMIEE